MQYSRQWQRRESAPVARETEYLPREVREAAEAASRKVPVSARPWWEARPIERRPVAELDPATHLAVEVAAAALDEATRWQRLIEARLERAGRLVDRVRELDAVRMRPDLVDELDSLDPADPEGCLHTVGIVLAEALGLRSVPCRDERFDDWLRSLESLADRAEGRPHQVMVVPGAGGAVQGRMPRRPVSGVEVRDSAAVMWGARNRLEVTHLCVVERPVIEIADLVDMSEDGPVFDWSAWEYSAGGGGGGGGSVSGSSATAVSGGYWTNIWNCTGVTIGNDNTMDVTYVYRMASCRMNLAPLLRDDRVRAELALCRDDSPGNAAQAQEARQRLPKTVARVANILDLSALVSEDEIAAQAARIRLPRVHGGSARILVSHGVGVAIGVDPEVSSQTRVRVGLLRVR